VTLDAATERPAAIENVQMVKRRPDGDPSRLPSRAAEVGMALRDARERSDLAMADIHDRTGISWAHLEALEDGDFARFPDQLTAFSCLGRYADLFDLDANAMTTALKGEWPEDTLADALRGDVPSCLASSPSAGLAPSDLLTGAFNSESSWLASDKTSQFPRMVTAPLALRGRYSARTGVFSAVHTPPLTAPVSLGLRLAVWFTAMLVAVGAVALAIH